MLDRLFNPLKQFHEKEYQKHQEAVANEVAAEELKDRLEQTQEALRLANDTIDLANAIAKDGDPYKARLAAFAKRTATGAAEHVLTGADPIGGGRGATQATPFEESSLPRSEASATSLPSSTPAKGLTHESTEPPRPRRGRPPKHTKG
jgi:hypothetical protein